MALYRKLDPSIATPTCLLYYQTYQHTGLLARTLKDVRRPSTHEQYPSVGITIFRTNLPGTSKCKLRVPLGGTDTILAGAIPVSSNLTYRLQHWVSGRCIVLAPDSKEGVANGRLVTQLAVIVCHVTSKASLPGILCSQLAIVRGPSGPKLLP